MVKFICPIIFDIVQIKQIGNVPAYYSAVLYTVVAFYVEYFFALHIVLFLTGAAVFLYAAGVIQRFDFLFPGQHNGVKNIFGFYVHI